MLRIIYLLLVGVGGVILSPPCDAQGRGATGAQELKPQVYAVLGQVMKGIKETGNRRYYCCQTYAGSITLWVGFG